MRSHAPRRPMLTETLGRFSTFAGIRCSRERTFPCSRIGVDFVTTDVLEVLAGFLAALAIPQKCSTSEHSYFRRRPLGERGQRRLPKSQFKLTTACMAPVRSMLSVSTVQGVTATHLRIWENQVFPRRLKNRIAGTGLYGADVLQISGDVARPCQVAFCI